ncbi:MULTISPECIES: SH3 domain-containing protein [unclassified Neptuniibacter]|uniref:SH3 domain-containing protein n=1 Tax=unclassified Neptuniibacter TaxID=2630693 RepID=UPI0026E44997|nr:MULTISPECIES: SH3 domain-containing protein [unclassified Neptuniibacter]MDO6514811.1 SH3 domain-containing protein [Neptuniibacter sp. 2_MG-2023]MDO6593319.1 SH3 domain-containing protein [Neptuniibacter sp. 1_MG-2023]
MRLCKIFLGCWFALFASSALAVDFYVVTVDALNVRQGPDYTWNVIAKAPQNQLVLETRREGAWSEVFYQNANKANVKGWVYSKYIQPQTLTPETGKSAKFAIKVTAEQPVCEGRSMITGGSLCYLDVSFNVQSKTVSQERITVSCWADFVVPGRESVTPVQATVTKNYLLDRGGVGDTVRLKAGLKQQLDLTNLNVAYYNCSVN